MNNLQLFSHEKLGKVHVLYENGKPLFRAGDVCKALGYKNTSKAIADHCKGVIKRDTLTRGGKQSVNFLPEGDLYRLICHSKLPSADQFECWIFDEVLPSMRQNGAYTTQQISKPLSDRLHLLAEGRAVLQEMTSVHRQVCAKRDEAKAEYLAAKATYGSWCDLVRQTEAARDSQAEALQRYIDQVILVAANPIVEQALIHSEATPGEEAP